MPSVRRCALIALCLLPLGPSLASAEPIKPRFTYQQIPWNTNNWAGGALDIDSDGRVLASPTNLHWHTEQKKQSDARPAVFDFTFWASQRPYGTLWTDAYESLNDLSPSGVQMSGNGMIAGRPHTKTNFESPDSDSPLRIYRREGDTAVFHHEVAVPMYGRITDINDRGEVAYSGYGKDGQRVASIYADGKFRELAHPNGGSVAINALNDHGDAVGAAQTDSRSYYQGHQALVFRDGKVEILTPPADAPLGATVEAVDINNSGQILVNVTTPGEYYQDNRTAYVYQDGHWTNLGQLGEGTITYASAINGSGVVVGWSNGRAFLYTDNQMLDLDDLLPEEKYVDMSSIDSPTYSEHAYNLDLRANLGINDLGQISVTAQEYQAYRQYSGQSYSYAFRLDPDSPLLGNSYATPEPTTFALLAAAGGGWLLRRRKKFGA